MDFNIQMTGNNDHINKTIKILNGKNIDDTLSLIYCLLKEYKMTYKQFNYILKSFVGAKCDHNGSRHGNKGKIKGVKRIAVFKRDKNICQCCGQTEELTIDHIVPKSVGGSNKAVNLQTLCRICNTLKGTKIINYTNTQNSIRHSNSFKLRLKRNEIS